MNKKEYSKPSIRVVSMKHRIGILCYSENPSGSKSASKVRGEEDFSEDVSLFGSGSKDR